MNADRFCRRRRDGRRHGGPCAGAPGHEVFAFDADGEALRVPSRRARRRWQGPARSQDWPRSIVIMVATDAQAEAVVEEILGEKPGKDAVIVVAATNHPAR